MRLSVVGETVDCIGIDHMVTLRFSNGASTAFESTFTVREPTGAISEVALDGDKSSLVRALHLHTQSVRAAQIRGSSLGITFSSGVVLRADLTLDTSPGTTSDRRIHRCG